MRAALLAAVRFYQRAISPNLAPRCRFQPTCSVYALEAIEAHGAARGSWLALRRIVKCAPWHPGGVDLVPERRTPSSPSGTAEGGRSSSMPTPRASGEPTSSTAPAHPDHRATPALHGAPHEESPVA